jgi:hypothetical protein
MSQATLVDQGAVRRARRRFVARPQVPAYVVARQAIGVKPGTIRRELSALVTMLRLAYEHGKLLRLPTVHKPKDGPAPRRILRGGAVCGRAALLARGPARGDADRLHAGLADAE